MAHLIDKDALVAWAKETYLCENASMIRRVCYKQLLEHLDTLEVKEVNSNGAFIDSMNSGMDYDKLDIMLDDALAKETKESWNERLGKEEPVSEDLDTEIQKYKDAYIEIINNHSVMAAEGIDIIARHFVDWKRKQMMENAVEETVFVDRWRDQEVVSHYFDWDEGFKAGQKVKLIVIKQEEE